MDALGDPTSPESTEDQDDLKLDSAQRQLESAAVSAVEVKVDVQDPAATESLEDTKDTVAESQEDREYVENPKSMEDPENTEGSDESAKDSEDTEGPEDEDEEEQSEVDSNFLKRVSSFSFDDLPMPDSTEFFVPLPEDLQPDAAANVENLPEPEPRPLAPLPQVIHVSGILESLYTSDAVPGVQGIQVAHVGLKSGLTGDLQATYLRLPPGTRTSRPVAQRLGDSITYCISGRGLLWQNGWTFPFEATDCVGWKGGTGIVHTIINDSNRDGSLGEDLILITAHEVREGDAFFYPLEPYILGEDANIGDRDVWKDPPLQGDFGPHPGSPSVVSGQGIQNIPEPLQGYRPSNAINAIMELDSIGEGELFANATSLSQETGLSGRFGCNFEVPPPGTRSSDAHAHSLEDELVYVVSGNGLVWINGEVQPVCEGDAVGFPGGTGITHTFINDSNADGAEGEPLILWIIGQNKVKEGDLLYYPLHAEKKSKSRRWWEDRPRYELGPHNGRPRRPLKL